MSREHDRKIPIQVYLSENEKYVLDEKIKESKMRNISEYIRHLILYGYVYDIDYNGLKEYSYQIAALGRNIIFFFYKLDTLYFATSHAV